MDKLVVRGTEINVQWDLKRDDFLSLTDIAKIKDSDNPRYIIQNWLRNRNTIAISQMKVLTEDHRILQLDAAENK